MCKLCDNIDAREIIYLDCANCDAVKTLPADMPNLKILSIYNTSISEIPEYPSLETLYCFNTPLEYLPSLPKLRKLVAHNTNLRALNSDLYRAEIVKVDNTQIDEIPECLINLVSVSADCTNVSSISSKLISLEWLSIQNTKVVEMPEGMMSLQFLNCSGTEVSDIIEENYPMLRKIVCRGCSIDPFQFCGKVDVMM